MLLKPLYDAGKTVPAKGLFEPGILTEEDFADIAVCDTVKKAAIQGSEFFRKRFEAGLLFPQQSCSFEEVDLCSELEVHDYTGKCPVQTFEVNPVLGCNLGCAYCLVNDGVHESARLYQNYHKLLEKRLAQHWREEHYYYFSPKTEALCEATLQSGMAHRILQTFIEHFKEYPGSKARLFIASKAGVEALQFEYEGERILDLFIRLKDKMQFNTSLSILPDECLPLMEPYSCSLQNRLEAVALCRKNGIMANSALVQPILVHHLSNELMEEFFATLASYGIVNFKPEFLTVCVENMALLAQILKIYDKDALKKLFETYFQEDNLGHIKQRKRVAPPRDLSLYWIDRMKTAARRHGISISICHWVREQLDIGSEDIPIVNENGFRCLGYQTRLF